MSSISLQSNASGAAVFTLVSPATATNRTLTIPDATTTLVGTDATQTLTNKTIGAGTASVPPLLLTTGTNLTSATAGAVEYASPIFTATPISTERGIVSTAQYYRLNSAFAGSNATGAQSLFGVSVTLSASTVYEFEMVFCLIKAAGTTSHTASIGFGGTATLNNIGYLLCIDSGATSTTLVNATNILFIQTASATVSTGPVTAAAFALQYVVKGTVSINAGGTFIPQYTLSAAPGGAYSTQIGSYIKIYPIGAAGAATNVGTWA